MPRPRAGQLLVVVQPGGNATSHYWGQEVVKLPQTVEPFPAELSQQLPRLPSGYSRVFVEGRVLILDRNNKIFDIMAIVR